MFQAFDVPQYLHDSERAKTRRLGCLICGNKLLAGFFKYQDEPERIVGRHSRVERSQLNPAVFCGRCLKRLEGPFDEHAVR